MPKNPPDARPAPAAHPPPWLVERLAFEPEAADAEARRHADSCADCGSAVARLAEAGRQFLIGRPARLFVAAVQERSSRDAAPATHWWPPRWWARWLLVPAAAAAVVLALAIPSRSPREDAAHVKGAGAALRIFVAHHDGQVARPIEPGTVLRPGDLLRFGVIAPGARHAFVASVDEAGRFSRYYPAGASGVGPLDGSGSLQLLPGSVELDETTGREWIVLLVSREPLEEKAVREALLSAWRARRGDSLGPLGLGAEAVVVPVTKVAP